LVKKAAVPCGTAEFREETSKKDSKRMYRLAAMHKVGVLPRRRKSFFAVQQKYRHAPSACHGREGQPS
jgi:hypothetical protein